MPQWYRVENGQQQGPYDEGQIRAMALQGQLRPDDLIWADGMANWVPAGSVPGLLPQAAPGSAWPAGAAPSATFAAAPMMPPGGAPATMVVRPDAGPFHKVGGQFRVGKTPWAGKVVASPQAVYLFKLRRVQTQ